MEFGAPSGLREARQAELREVVRRHAARCKVREDLAHDSGELVAVPRAGRGDHDLWKVWQGVDDEMLVGREGVEADPRREVLAVSLRDVAGQALAQALDVGQAGIAVQGLRVAGLAAVVRPADLDAGMVPAR